MKRPQIHRIVFIHSWLKANRYPNKSQLAKELEVSPRTVLRDVQYLQELCSAPISYDPKRKGYFYLEPSFELPFMQLTEGEILALVLGLGVLSAFKGTSLEAALKSAATKLPALLPNHVSVELEALSRAISFGIEPLRGQEELVSNNFKLINDAIRQHRRVKMFYYTASRDDHTVRKVDPYHIRFMGGAWYLFAFCHMRKEIRIFALDRIERATLLRETFNPNQNFDVDEFLKDTWRLEKGGEQQHVRIRFDPVAARYIRGKQWHQSQVISEEDDGGLTMEVTVSGLNEVARWLLQFGARAEVLEPLELREAMKQEIEKMRMLYGFGFGN